MSIFSFFLKVCTVVNLEIVSYFYVEILVHQYVLWFEIFVNDLVPREINHPLQDLQNDPSFHRYWNRHLENTYTRKILKRSKSGTFQKWRGISLQMLWVRRCLFARSVCGSVDLCKYGNEANNICILVHARVGYVGQQVDCEYSEFSSESAYYCMSILHIKDTLSDFFCIYTKIPIMLQIVIIQIVLKAHSCLWTMNPCASLGTSFSFYLFFYFIYANRIAFVKKGVFVLKCSYFALISSHKYIFTLGTKKLHLGP